MEFRFQAEGQNNQPGSFPEQDVAEFRCVQLLCLHPCSALHCSEVRGVRPGIARFVSISF